MVPGSMVFPDSRGFLRLEGKVLLLLGKYEVLDP